MKKNRNTWKEVYSKCNHNKYTQLVNIKEKAEIKSNFKNFLANYKILFLSILLILLVLFIYTFKNTPITILYCVGFILLLIVLAIFSNTYKLTINEEKVLLNINFQKSEILSNNLATIYLSRDKTRIFGIPIYSYLLNIVYLLDEKPILIELPVIMTNRKNIVKFFSNFEFNKIKDDDDEIKERENNILIMKTIAIAVIIVIAILLLIGIFLYNRY